MVKKEFTWQGLKWRVGHPWGISHPDKRNTWFGNKSVNITDDGVLELSVKFEPKEFDGICKLYSVGLVSCMQSFGYGTYKWDVELPVGTNLWPALWVCGEKSWPPEIDMMEAYSYSDTESIGYIYGCRSKIETNIHYMDDDGTHKNVKAKGIPAIIYKMFRHKDRIDEYKFIWTEKYVKFYFNGIRVRKVKNKKAMANLSKDRLVYPIMNLEINENFSSFDNNKYKPVFKIYNFQYLNIS